MKTIAGRPTGVMLIAVLVVANGLSSLVEAMAIADPTITGLVSAGVSALLGLALIHRAYALWNLQRGAWLITVILLGLRFVFGILELVSTSFSALVWISLALTLIAVLYLVQPSVREAFSGRRSGT